jgi:hypothetical protein
MMYVHNLPTSLIIGDETEGFQLAGWGAFSTDTPGVWLVADKPEVHYTISEAGGTIGAPEGYHDAN